MPADSKKQSLSKWDIALIGKDNEPLAKLIRDEPPEVVYRKFMELITTSYKMISSNPLELTRELVDSMRAELEESIRNRINSKIQYFENFRCHLGWPIQELNLAHLRELRKHNSLTLVVGAGVTMDAGGPSWLELVQELLASLLYDGDEIVTKKLVPRTGKSIQGSWADYKVVKSRRVIGPFPELIRNEAKSLIKKIEQKSDLISDEDLKNAAQLCIDVMGNDLFIHVASNIYSRVASPGPIHRAIADIAQPQIVIQNDGVTKEWKMGWDFIFTYNFDDLIGEALLEKKLPFARMVNKLGGVGGDPSISTLKEDKDLHLKVAHLHGYTPRRFFNIEDIDFVFSTSQYNEHTQQGKRNLIIETFKDKFVDEPVRTLLYVGCSFTDDAMNDLLMEAHERFPGREHYAMLLLPCTLRDQDQIKPDELTQISKEYRQRGVEPIWIRKFEEIPKMLRSLK